MALQDGLVEAMRGYIEPHSQDEVEGARQAGARRYEVWNFVIEDDGSAPAS